MIIPHSNYIVQCPHCKRWAYAGSGAFGEVAFWINPQARCPFCNRIISDIWELKKKEVPDDCEVITWNDEVTIVPRRRRYVDIQ